MLLQVNTNSSCYKYSHACLPDTLNKCLNDTKSIHLNVKSVGHCLNEYSRVDIGWYVLIPIATSETGLWVATQTAQIPAQTTMLIAIANYTKYDCIDLFVRAHFVIQSNISRAHQQHPHFYISRIVNKCLFEPWIDLEQHTYINVSCVMQGVGCQNLMFPLIEHMFMQHPLISHVLSKGMPTMRYRLLLHFNLFRKRWP